MLLHLEFEGLLNRSLLISFLIMKLSSFSLIKKIKKKNLLSFSITSVFVERLKWVGEKICIPVVELKM